MRKYIIIFLLMTLLLTGCSNYAKEDVIYQLSHEGYIEEDWRINGIYSIGNDCRRYVYYDENDSRHYVDVYDDTIMIYIDIDDNEYYAYSECYKYCLDKESDNLYFDIKQLE